MKLSGLTLFAAGTLAVACLSSCLSTDTVNPVSEKGESQIVINLSNPEPGATRASSDHRLRYVARLFLSTKGSLRKQPDMRAEILEGDSDAGGDVNQIVFNVTPGQDYVIQVFADYVTATQRNSSGYYDDKYYNTSDYTTSNTRVTMFTTPGDDPVSTKEFFNNDNYDCFVGWIDGTKLEQKEIKEIELKRAVSKVRFVDISGLEGPVDISVTKIGFFNTVDLDQNMWGTGRKPYSDAPFPAIKVTEGLQPQPNDQNESEILFFYTFVGGANLCSYITFTVSDNEGNSKTSAIEDGVITIKKNFITTVKGSFLPAKEEEQPGPDDPSVNPDEKGMLILDLSTDQNWSDPSLTANWN